MLFYSGGLGIQEPDHLAGFQADELNMGQKETTGAGEAAGAALKAEPSAHQRARWLSRIDELLVQNKEELSRIITLEQGKPLKESRVEVEYSAGFFRFYAEHMAALEAQRLPQPIRNLRWTIHHRPAGVAGL